MALTDITHIVFDEDIHQYIRVKDFAEIIGVTTLMKKMGLSPSEYKGVDPLTLHYAAERGSFMHHLFERFDNGEPIVITPIVVDEVSLDGYDERNRPVFTQRYSESGKPLTKELLSAKMVQKLFDSYRKLALPIERSEFLIADPTENVASSIDKVYKQNEDGSYDLGDLKFTSSVHQDALEAQLSIYAYFLEEQAGVKVRNLYCIHGDVKKGIMREIPVRRLTRGWVQDLLAAYIIGYEFVDNRRYVDEVGDDSRDMIIMSDADVPAFCSRVERITELESELKALNEELQTSKNMLYEYMTAKHLKQIGIGNVIIKCKSGSVRTSVNTKLLKEKYPDIAEQCTTQSETKGSISFIINNNQNGKD